MTRTIDLRLTPADQATSETQVSVYTYQPAERMYRAMAEQVYVDLEAGRSRFGVELTPDEARELASQLLQVAAVADQQRAARLADDELQASFDEISDELRDADEHGGRTGVFYAHPDVHYVPEDQIAAKVRELNAAGVKRFMVLAEPTEWADQRAGACAECQGAGTVRKAYSSDREPCSACNPSANRPSSSAIATSALASAG